MRRMTRLALTAAVFAVAGGCGARTSMMKNGELNQTIEAPKGDGDYIEAMGIGATDPGLANATQRKATSRNAAMVDAQYQLVAKIKGVTIEGGITVERAMETSSRITASVNNMVKGAEVTRLEWANDDGCIATMRLSRKAVEQELGLRSR